MKIIAALKGDYYLPDWGTYDDNLERFKRLGAFYEEYGYDIVSYESCMCSQIQQGKCLRGQAEPIITSLDDINNFDWKNMLHGYIANAEPAFRALQNSLRPGMKAIGGPGNGLFEAAQDFTSFTGLCMMQFDDPEAYELLWQKIGDVFYAAWEWFLPRFSDAFAVCRFGDDLGFHSATLIAPDEIKKHIIPQYKRIVDLIHRHNKPFLLHSCGKIYDVMDDLINIVKIDAKHSNEDSIDTFDVWLERYGDKIGNFGGVEMNVLCLNTEQEVRDYVLNICKISQGHGGVAIGSGNQISSYIKPESFIAMTETVREFRER